MTLTASSFCWSNFEGSLTETIVVSELSITSKRVTIGLASGGQPNTNISVRSHSGQDLRKWICFLKICFIPLFSSQHAKQTYFPQQRVTFRSVGRFMQNAHLIENASNEKNRMATLPDPRQLILSSEPFGSSFFLHNG